MSRWRGAPATGFVVDSCAGKLTVQRVSFDRRLRHVHHEHMVDCRFEDGPLAGSVCKYFRGGIYSNRKDAERRAALIAIGYAMEAS